MNEICISCGINKTDKEGIMNCKSCRRRIFDKLKKQKIRDVIVYDFVLRAVVMFGMPWILGFFIDIKLNLLSYIIIGLFVVVFGGANVIMTMIRINKIQKRDEEAGMI